MKHAHAVLQPTLFEGGPGGGSVYDAVSLGVPAIVSDIPVNLEIDDPTVSFFRARDPQDLAEKMRRALDSDRRPPDVMQLLASGLRRRRQYGKEILRSIRYVTG
jgi:glycosyltransferase involved in cell wall biosynthesis